MLRGIPVEQEDHDTRTRSSSLLGARREELCQAGQEGITPTSNEVADLALEPREDLPEARLGIELQAKHYIAEPLRPMGRGDKKCNECRRSTPVKQEERDTRTRGSRQVGDRRKEYTMPGGLGREHTP